jgi:hypothetical protein
MIFEELPTLASSCPDGVMETCSTSYLTTAWRVSECCNAPNATPWRPWEA